jgi:modulator of FtsH protease HflC
MSEGVSKAQSRSGQALRRTLLVLVAVSTAFALASSFFAVDVTEYCLVTRFGRVVRVIAEAGLYLTAPFDRVVRLDKRVLFSRAARSEYLTTDKKNIVVESLVTWRIADPQRFLATFGTRAAAEERLSDVVLAEIGSVIGRYPASVLISTDPAESQYQAIWSQIGRRVAEFARPAYGIDVVGLDLRRLSMPQQNREHVFDRMKAERARIAKENRSSGELEAKKIAAQAEHERTIIDADAAGQAERIRAEGDAEASRTYAAGFGRDPRFYEFLRTLQAYDKILDDKTTLFLPPDADVFRMLQFDSQLPPAPSVATRGVSTDADLLLKRKPEKGLP